MVKKYQFNHSFDQKQIEASKPDNGILVWVDPAKPDAPFVLASDLTVNGPDNFKRKILAGFRYDGASVPQSFWWFISRTDARVFPAATLHDSFYASADGARVVADAVFNAIMVQFGMPPLKRVLAYLAVRMFGRWSFKQK